MKKIIFFYIIFFIIIIVSCSTNTKVNNSKQPYIKLYAHPKQGFKPLTVILEAELMNYVGHEAKLNCIQEEWDFGDGNKSFYQPDCLKKNELKTKFITTHTYYTAGSYRIQLTLGKNIVRSQVIHINVFSSGI